MKIPFVITFFIGILFLLSCSDNTSINQTGILGEWQLKEQLLDPGDGSGVFIDVNSNKKIEFFDDDTFISNGTLCSTGINTGQGTIGTYDNEYIFPDNCNFLLSYEIDNNTLIINYPCIEPCKEKYIKL